MTDAPPRPGPLPEYGGGPLFSEVDIETWTAYAIASDEYWRHLAELAGRQVPCLGMEYIGGGSVLHFCYEDRSYAWLGGWVEGDDVDGPYAYGPVDRVGGFRYAPDRDGDTYTERVEVKVEDPEDHQSVADALVEAARKLGTLEFTETC